jgi:hypothetical protein
MQLHATLSYCAHVSEYLVEIIERELMPQRADTSSYFINFVKLPFTEVISFYILISFAYECLLVKLVSIMSKT